LINATSTNWNVIEKQYSKRALGRFLSRTAAREDLLELLPGMPNFCLGFNPVLYGADEEKRELKLAGDPWLKTMIDLMQVEDVQEVELIESVASNEWFRTHLPQCELEGVRAQWVHKIMAREFRENGWVTSRRSSSLTSIRSNWGGNSLTLLNVLKLYTHAIGRQTQ